MRELCSIFAKRDSNFFACLAGARLILVNSGKLAREKRRNDGTKFIARIYKDRQRDNNLERTRKIFFETVIYGDELTKTGSGTRIYKKTVLLQ